MSDDLLFFDAAAKGENAVASRELGKPLRVNPCSTQNEVYTVCPIRKPLMAIFSPIPTSKMKQNVSTSPKTPPEYGHFPCPTANQTQRTPFCGTQGSIRPNGLSQCEFGRFVPHRCH